MVSNTSTAIMAGVPCQSLPRQHPELNSTVPTGQLVCPGQNVTFSCVTGGKTIHWRSNEYIGQGSELTLPSFQGVGYTEHSKFEVNTVAKLTNIQSSIMGQVWLESELHITVTSNFPSFSVTCLSADLMNDTVTLQMLHDPDMPQNVTSNLRRNRQGRCRLHLSWSSPSNNARKDLSHFMVNVTGIDPLKEPNTSTMTSLDMCSCDYHHVSMVAVNRCGRTSPSTRRITVKLDQTPLHELECPTMIPMDGTYNTDDGGDYTTTANVNPFTTDGGGATQDQPCPDGAIVGGLLTLVVIAAVIVSIIITNRVTKYCIEKKYKPS